MILNVPLKTTNAYIIHIIFYNYFCTNLFYIHGNASKNFTVLLLTIENTVFSHL